MFATPEMVRRIEGVAAREGAALVRALQRLEPDGAAISEEVAGGMVVLCGPKMFVNRALGLGLNGPVTLAHIERVEELSAQVGVPALFEVCPVADPSVLELLSQRGYVLEGFRSVLLRDLSVQRDAPQPQCCNIEVVNDKSLADWQKCAHVGFEVQDDAMREISDRFTEARNQVEGETLLLARIGERTAACAAISIRDGVAELGGTATKPEFRRRGAQGALIAHRLALAAEAGCDVAVSAADPGGDSERNLHRFGFVLAYTEAFLTRPR